MSDDRRHDGGVRFPESLQDSPEAGAGDAPGNWLANEAGFEYQTGRTPSGKKPQRQPDPEMDDASDFLTTFGHDKTDTQ